MNAKVIILAARQPKLTPVEAFQNMYWSWWATSFSMGVAMLNSVAQHGFANGKGAK